MSAERNNPKPGTLPERSKQAGSALANAERRDGAAHPHRLKNKANGSPPRARPAEMSLPRERSGRIFHTAFYSEEELRQIAGLIHFDADFYRSRYPEIVAQRIDPLQHFLTRGIDESGLPSNPANAPNGDWLNYLLGFDAAFYQVKYPDTPPAHHEHFMRYGAREGRLPFNLEDNLASEQFLAEVLDSLDIDSGETLEAQGRLDAERWRQVPEALLARAQFAGLIPKPFRNNFWLAMAAGLLAQCRFGAAACCYNMFFNYYIPVPFLGNWRDGMIGTGCIFSIAQGMARAGTGIAGPKVVETAEVPEPVFLNRPNRSSDPVRLSLPRPAYGVLPNVEAISGSSLMIQNGHVVLYDYVEHGERARELQCTNLLHVVGQNCSFRLPARTTELREAFSLFHDHGHNYHHWLLEIIPRYLLARAHGMSCDVPLLIAKDTAPQMREVLRQAAGTEPTLVELPRGESMQVGKMHVASDINLNSVHTECEPEPGDILFSPTAIEMIRELGAPHFTHDQAKFANVLIVRRNVGFRRLINQAVLLEVMKSLGLWAFDPGGADWPDQVRVFSNARLIVAEAGAALANMVFCRPGATMIVLVNGHHNSNYFYLTQLARLVGVHLYFFECLRLAGSHEIGVQDDMIVPVGQLADWVRRALREPEFRPCDAVTAADGEPGTRRPKRNGAASPRLAAVREALNGLAASPSAD